jgi:hypothetical protein
MLRRALVDREEVTLAAGRSRSSHHLNFPGALQGVRVTSTPLCFCLSLQLLVTVLSFAPASRLPEAT